MELGTFLFLSFAELFLPFITLPLLPIWLLVLFLHFWVADSISGGIKGRFGVAEKWGGRKRVDIPTGGPRTSMETINAAGEYCSCKYCGLNLGGEEEDHFMGLASRLVESV